MGNSAITIYAVFLFIIAIALIATWAKRGKRIDPPETHGDRTSPSEVQGKEQSSEGFIKSEDGDPEIGASLSEAPEEIKSSPEIAKEQREELAFIDLETTGLDPINDRIIEVALFILPIGVSCEVEGYSNLANPGIPVPRRITEITGITQEMVADQRPVGEVVGSLLDAIGDRPVAAYNAEFDISFLRSEARRIGREFSNESVCIMQYAKRKHPDLARYRLGDVCDAFGIFESESEKSGMSEHRALYDAERALRLFLAISAGRLPNPPSPRAADRGLNYENLEKYHSLRTKAKGLSKSAKERESINLDEAIDIHFKAIRMVIEAGRIEIYTTKADWSGESMTGDIGEISCLDRLTICLCKRKRAAEAAEATDEYFSVFPKQADLKAASAIRARIAKAAAKS